ncbi:MAG: DUF6457 domain-containing protein [Actinobacteria bacterium]|nr:DUF6457 domain-containing protein [Actinomycetota bacterium]
MSSTRDEWLGRYASLCGGSTLDEEAMGYVLELAGVAAHSSERSAAPLACWIAAAAGLTPKDAFEFAKQISEANE